jgi:hypothetical protein
VEPAGRGSSRGLLAWVHRHEPVRWSWRNNAGWPTAVASENGVSHGADAGAAGTTLAQPRWPSAVAGDDDSAPYPPVRSSTIGGAGSAAAGTGQARAAKSETGATNGTNGTGGINGTSRVNGTATFDTETGETGDEFEEPGRTALGSGAVGLLGRLARAAWDNPLEATAIILLGLGGVIFPPVFVLGAAVALGSRLWHYRDKWAGLVLPPLLTIIAAAAAIALGGRSHGLHYAWLSLNVVSRIAALLGAGYLAWRTGPGRRPPPQPPWHKPHRAT